MTAAVIANPTTREFLRNADPMLAQVIDAHPDFRPRTWIDEHLHRTRDGRGAERRRPYPSLAVSYLFASEFEEGT